MEGLIQCGGLVQPVCGFCDIFVLGTNIINFFLIPTSSNNGFAIVPLIATLLLVWGGFSLVVAGGNPQAVSSARTVLTAVVIGLIIVYASWIFVNTMFQALGISQWAGLGNWWQIQCNAPVSSSQGGSEVEVAGLTDSAIVKAISALGIVEQPGKRLALRVPESAYEESYQQAMKQAEGESNLLEGPYTSSFTGQNEIVSTLSFGPQFERIPYAVQYSYWINGEKGSVEVSVTSVKKGSTEVSSQVRQGIQREASAALQRIWFAYRRYARPTEVRNDTSYLYLTGETF
ncbi:MAG: hypothetical protein Q7R55_00270 [Candidatus Wildermuthbacteria bacterium]|nr:hypothetical protein [Candidatus Wildermuthbacteria bacterium]